MRMKKRGIIVWLLLALVWVMAGCGAVKEDKMDPKELITRMIEAADGRVVTQSDCVAVLNLRQGDELTGRDIKTTYKTHNMYDKESYRASSETKFSVNGEAGIDVKYHLVEEQGILYYYAWDEEYGWLKSEACFEKEDMARNFVSSMNLEKAEILGLETKDIKVADKDAYKLSLKLKDAKIRELLFDSGIKYCLMGKEYASVDLSDVEVTMEYYVDPETANVLKVEAKLEGMQNFIRYWLEYKLAEEAEETLRITKLAECTLIYDNISYDDIELPQMSFEDKKNSVWIHQKEEIYTIRMLDCEVDITWPQGWYGAIEDRDLLMIYRADDKINRSFYFDIYVDEQSMYDNYIVTAVEDYKEMGIYVADKEGPIIGDFKTHEILLENGVVSYAFAQIGDIWLIVNVEDTTSTRLDKSLPEVLETVKWG